MYSVIVKDPTIMASKCRSFISPYDGSPDVPQLYCMSAIVFFANAGFSLKKVKNTLKESVSILRVFDSG